MKHGYQETFDNRGICVVCGYDELSHASNAICEACGAVADCDLFPDTKHPKKMLICPACKQKEYETAKRVTDERTRSYEVVKTSGDYYNSDIPAILKIKQTIEADPNIENKAYAIAEAIKARIRHFDKTLFEKQNEISAIRNERSESQIYLNHHMKELSAEQQKQLGLNDIKYKPGINTGKTPKKAPSIKKHDNSELKKYANQFGLDIVVLKMTAMRRNVSIEQAAKICIATNNKIAENN
jgi:hypothetical protein